MRMMHIDEIILFEQSSLLSCLQMLTLTSFFKIGRSGDSVDRQCIYVLCDFINLNEKVSSTL